jgi:hypothetical protein
LNCEPSPCTIRLPLLPPTICRVSHCYIRSFIPIGSQMCQRNIRPSSPAKTTKDYFPPNRPRYHATIRINNTFPIKIGMMYCAYQVNSSTMHRHEHRVLSPSYNSSLSFLLFSSSSISPACISISPMCICTGNCDSLREEYLSVSPRRFFCVTCSFA